MNSFPLAEPRAGGERAFVFRSRPVRLFIPPLYSDRHLRLHKTHLDPEFLQLRPCGLAAGSLRLPSVRRPHPPRDAARSVECHRFVLGSANNNTGAAAGGAS